jgi:mRNA-degrading endonuclease RelE of RelBE toxin-antitoxin system
MTVGVSKSFLKEVEQFKDKEEILAAVRSLRKLKTLYESTHFRKISGSKNKYRMRLGKYRIMFLWLKEKQEIQVISVALRKDIYKKK